MDAAFPTIPTLDVSKLHTANVLAGLEEACRDWGVFRVVGHEIPVAHISALEDEMRRFFARPIEEKRRVERTLDNPWGFSDRELTKNERDRKQVFDCGPADMGEGPTPWPVDAAGLRAAAQQIAGACEALSFRLLRAIASNLDVAFEDLSRAFQPSHSSFLRLNYYPAERAPEIIPPNGTSGLRAFGVNHHTDAGALTLLFQDDCPGLEVYRHGSWKLVEPGREAVVVNLGDIVQVWSNDRYRAALHRVRASTARDRYSAPYFFNPAYSSTYAPLPEVVAEQGARPRFRPIRWGEFRSRRAAGDYADVGAEVQIDDYRIPSWDEQETRHGLH